ncbi:hypothetical protein BDR26DRAFT_962564 [Obelidium mucronatum]|nr:hypothetical protein BDR26DRAFT_962564 [Obelidium mucronatum]
MIPRYRGLGILVAVARALPILCHIAYLVFIIKGLISDIKSKADIPICTYFVFSALGHSLCLISHCIAPFSEEDLELTAKTIGCYLLGTVLTTIFGWFMFRSNTGEFITDYISIFGFSEWRTLPLLLQIMYFNMWLALATVITAVFLAVVTCIACVLSLAFDFLRRKPKPAPLVSIVTIPPLVAVSDVPPLVSES